MSQYGNVVEYALHCLLYLVRTWDVRHSRGDAELWAAMAAGRRGQDGSAAATSPTP